MSRNKEKERRGSLDMPIGITRIRRRPRPRAELEHTVEHRADAVLDLGARAGDFFVEREVPCGSDSAQRGDGLGELMTSRGRRVLHGGARGGQIRLQALEFGEERVGQGMDAGVGGRRERGDGVGGLGGGLAGNALLIFWLSGKIKSSCAHYGGLVGVVVELTRDVLRQDINALVLVLCIGRGGTSVQAGNGSALQIVDEGSEALSKVSVAIQKMGKNCGIPCPFHRQR